MSTAHEALEAILQASEPVNGVADPVVVAQALKRLQELGVRTDNEPEEAR